MGNRNQGPPVIENMTTTHGADIMRRRKQETEQTIEDRLTAIETALAAILGRLENQGGDNDDD